MWRDATAIPLLAVNSLTIPHSHPHLSWPLQCAQTVFHSAGREDSDVRMLGGGRPFVVELVNSFVRPDDLDATAEV